MVHDSLWDEIATETNMFAVQFYEKNPNSPTISQWFPTTSHEIKSYCALCVLMSQVKLDMRVPSVWWRYMFQTILGLSHHKKLTNKHIRDQPNITAQQGYVLKSKK